MQLTTTGFIGVATAIVLAVTSLKGAYALCWYNTRIAPELRTATCCSAQESVGGVNSKRHSSMKIGYDQQVDLAERACMCLPSSPFFPWGGWLVVLSFILLLLYSYACCSSQQSSRSQYYRPSCGVHSA